MATSDSSTPPSPYDGRWSDGDVLSSDEVHGHFSTDPGPEGCSSSDSTILSPYDGHWSCPDLPNCDPGGEHILVSSGSDCSTSSSSTAPSPYEGQWSDASLPNQKHFIEGAQAQGSCCPTGTPRTFLEGFPGRDVDVLCTVGKLHRLFVCLCIYADGNPKIVISAQIQMTAIVHSLGRMVPHTTQNLLGLF